jgi:hypothetical protein
LAQAAHHEISCQLAAATRLHAPRSSSMWLVCLRIGHRRNHREGVRGPLFFMMRVPVSEADRLHQ